MLNLYVVLLGFFGQMLKQYLKQAMTESSLTLINPGPF
jgi:hypothetical protein